MPDRLREGNQEGGRNRGPSSRYLPRAHLEQQFVAGCDPIQVVKAGPACQDGGDCLVPGGTLLQDDAHQGHAVPGETLPVQVGPCGRQFHNGPIHLAGGAVQILGEGFPGEATLAGLAQ